jgi:hypothetical protein
MQHALRPEDIAFFAYLAMGVFALAVVVILIGNQWQPRFPEWRWHRESDYVDMEEPRTTRVDPLSRPGNWGEKTVDPPDSEA